MLRKRLSIWWRTTSCFSIFFSVSSEKKKTGKYIVFKNNQNITNLMIEIMREIADQQPYFEQMINGYLITLFAQLVRIH